MNNSNSELEDLEILYLCTHARNSCHEIYENCIDVEFSSDNRCRLQIRIFPEWFAVVTRLDQSRGFLNQEPYINHIIIDDPEIIHISTIYSP